MTSSSKPTLVTAGQRKLLKLLLLVALSFCSYLFFSRLVVTAVEVKGVSMSPTLIAGDLFMLNRFAYLTREPQRGELVVLKDPETGELIVKRIVGMPCETVVMQNDIAYINGKRLPEPYATRLTRMDRSQFGKATVIPRGCYFVLGDNRTRSLDSRVFGPIKRDSILGVISL
ncbi:MAG TPA: signal peptidase I [Verrucomicrobiae bacterium]|jgi:signal peptidase I